MQAWYLTSLIASSLGLYISTYVSMVYFGLISPKSWWMLPFLRLGDESVCDQVVRSEYGTFFKIPNAAIGYFYYLLIAFISLKAFTAGGTLYILSVLVLSGLVLLFSFYLIWALIFRVKQRCVICYTAHFLNLVIFVCWLVVLLKIIY
ncbi:vitamin K epoxide reductase family protein [Bdellovibrionota bacterium]